MQSTNAVNFTQISLIHNSFAYQRLEYAEYILRGE